MNKQAALYFYQMSVQYVSIPIFQNNNENYNNKKRNKTNKTHSGLSKMLHSLNIRRARRPFSTSFKKTRMQIFYKSLRKISLFPQLQ